MDALYSGPVKVSSSRFPGMGGEQLQDRERPEQFHCSIANGDLRAFPLVEPEW
jgi:hypothetical protein